MKKNCCKSSIKGFTLIELLVVVLIIGILAAIALPQYQKAVRKARLSEVMVRAKTLMNGIDLYLLTNGGVPSTGSTITFLGDANATLDVELSWDSADGKYSYTKLGKWAAACSDGSSCTIQFRSAYHGDQTEGNNWLDGAELELDKNGESSPWILGYTDNKVICDWWKQNFGSSRIYSGTCNE